MSHILEFTDLVDTPNDFSGFPNYYLKVNSSASAVEFQSAANLEIALGGPFLPLTGGDVAGHITLDNTYAFRIRDSGDNIRNGVFIDGDGNMYIGDAGLPLEFYGSLTRPTYAGGNLALFSDLHAASHDVASHSDTSATGAELNELTDSSETTLHSHAGGGDYNIDGGAADSVYTAPQLIDGGNA